MVPDLGSTNVLAIRSEAVPQHPRAEVARPDQTWYTGIVLVTSVRNT